MADPGRLQETSIDSLTASATVLLGGNSSSIRRLAERLRQDGLRAVEADSSAEVIESFDAFRRSRNDDSWLAIVVLDFQDPPWLNSAVAEYLQNVDWQIPVVVVGSEECEQDESRAVPAFTSATIRMPRYVDALRSLILKAVPFTSRSAA
jgi:hypothetical protein